ncbi:MAG: HD domain-containing protein [Thermoleophilia bacterium]|nr:HD domain-containing protein [Thermoleophilia bacterium]
MKTMLKELAPGRKITDFFVCASKNVRVDKNGNRFLHLRLTDASGNIGAVMWEVSDAVAECFQQGQVVKIQGAVTSDHRGQTQVKLDKIRAATAGDDFDLAELLPSSARDLQEMEAELAAIRESIASPDLAVLLDEIFNDEIIYRQFCEAPAAKGVHHNYIHGLLEHTVSVCRVADAIAAQYPGDVNRDLLVAAALLHDIGKISEFDYTVAIDYSDQGRLLGHIIIGEKIVSDAIGRLDSFPEELRLQLLHLVLAHHGEKEYGSPVRPKTLEGFILNHADDVDAKANIFTRLRAESVESGTAWSQFHRVLDRFLYLRKTEE